MKNLSLARRYALCFAFVPYEHFSKNVHCERIYWNEMSIVTMRYGMSKMYKFDSFIDSWHR